MNSDYDLNLMHIRYNIVCKVLDVLMNEPDEAGEHMDMDQDTFIDACKRIENYVTTGN